MGRIVSMSGETKFKLTTVQREVWFFTKIVSSLALSLFIISIIIWAAWLRTSYPNYETASGAIINSIGCLTAFVPQVRPTFYGYIFVRLRLGISGFADLCGAFSHYSGQADGQAERLGQEPRYH